MHRHRHYLSATLPGQGRRPPMEITLHAEGDELILAVSTEPGRRSLRNPPGKATVAKLVAMVAEEVGACSLGAWERYGDGDDGGGWMTAVVGVGGAKTLEALATA